MPTAVLVHGGFHGGWCWQKVAAPLLAAGWNVYSPSLTGVADRAHLASPQISLETHIRDVTSLIEFEELDDVVLCGHSAGGMVVSAAADRLADRIRHVVYLDAAVPNNGQSFFDVLGEESGMPQVLRDQAIHEGGWLVAPAPFFTAESLGVVNEADAAWVNRRLTSHPISAFRDPVLLKGAVDHLRKTYVRAKLLPVPALNQLAASLEKQAHWRVEWWDCGHDLMIVEPDRVCELLKRVGS